MHVIHKRKFIINGDSKQTFDFTILYFLSPNRNITFLIFLFLMTLISVRFHYVLAKTFQRFIGLNVKLSNNQVNIFGENHKVLCYHHNLLCQLIQQQKEVANANIKKEWIYY